MSVINDGDSFDNAIGIEETDYFSDFNNNPEDDDLLNAADNSQDLYSFEEEFERLSQKVQSKNNDSLQSEKDKENETEKEAQNERRIKKINYGLIVLIVLLMFFMLAQQYVLRKSDENMSVYSEIVTSESEKEDDDASINKININTADTEELQQLKGIGETRANAIIEYREENGKFYDIEDIKNVNGIGDTIFENIKDSICIE